jgi:hypothetical protein
MEVERGDVDLRPANPVPKIDVELRNGNVDLVIPKGGKFNLKARADRGELQNEYGDALKTAENDHGGTITGNVGDGAAITINSSRGMITVRKADESTSAAPLTPQPPSPPRREGEE